jgi:hypothetical protein
MTETFKIVSLISRKLSITISNHHISLLLGFVQEAQGKYTGVLQRDIKNDFKFIIRPNISF